MKVLLVTRSDDNHCVEDVRVALKKRGATGLRFDTDCYPTGVGLSTETSQRGTRRWLRTPDGAVDLERLESIWYRRFLAGGQLPESLGDLRDPSVDESRRTLYGSIAATPCFQLDPLAAVRRCDHKELQLREALVVGLDVPRTLSSNEPEAVRTFARAVRGPIVTKMQHSFAVHRDGRENVVFTNELTADDLASLDGLALCPMTFQEKLPKRLELRATVVGQRVFTAAVDSQALEGAKLDWRKEGVTLLEAWTKYELPSKVSRALLKLTARFGLNYAAADFIVTPDGRHVFLELNAGGEFYWLQRVPGLPIAEALADVLTGRAKRVKSFR
ncbi:MAG: MvdD family ATP-grasp ribosomal peptide maturase [Myxococcaceae bacterium]